MPGTGTDEWGVEGDATLVSGEALKLNDAITGDVRTSEMGCEAGQPTVAFDRSFATNYRTPEPRASGVG